MLKQSVIDSVNKINAIRNELSDYIVEREETLYIIAVALISKRNAFFLGKTGQAKSYAVREFTKRIIGSEYFELLMNKMLESDALFGRLDIPALVQGQSKIITAGKLPEANINFLDEIFKSNEVILNSLLQVLNYEDITLEGNKISLPTIATFSASNEIPNFKKEEDQILYPLYNRLHLKLVSDYIKDKDNFKKAVQAKRTKSGQQTVTTINLDELLELNKEVENIIVPDDIDSLVWEICQEISKKLNREVSDRKKIEYSILVQANAMLNGRDSVIPEDCKVLKYYLWEMPEEIETINEIVTRMCENPLKDKIEGLTLMAVEQINEALKVVTDTNINAKNRAFSKAEKELFQLHTMMKQIEQQAKSAEDTRMVEAALKKFEDMYSNLNKEFKYTYIPIQQMKERSGM